MLMGIAFIVIFIRIIYLGSDYVQNSPTRLEKSQNSFFVFAVACIYLLIEAVALVLIYLSIDELSLEIDVFSILIISNIAANIAGIASLVKRNEKVGYDTLNGLMVIKLIIAGGLITFLDDPLSGWQTIVAPIGFIYYVTSEQQYRFKNR